MKVIFLDIDGVLNNQFSKSRCGYYIGIDKDKVRRLKEIVDATNAKIVLVSSWKSDWERADKDSQNIIGNYLDKRLKREKITIFDKTEDHDFDRGKGIRDWISKYNVESWVVLDDIIFDDYHTMGVLPHLVKTVYSSENGGLQPEHVIKAIEILNKFS